MVRRLEIQGICNDLLASFASRYNDLSDYWALGMFQGFLQANSVEQLCFDLVGISPEAKKPIFPQISAYYSSALQRHLKTRKIPTHWVEAGNIKVRRTSPTELMCLIEVKIDLGRVFASQTHVIARPHDPVLESQRATKFGPSNQRGQ